MADDNKNNIDKALEALTGALELEPKSRRTEMQRLELTASK